MPSLIFGQQEPTLQMSGIDFGDSGDYWCEIITADLNSSTSNVITISAITPMPMAKTVLILLAYIIAVASRRLFLETSTDSRHRQSLGGE